MFGKVWYLVGDASVQSIVTRKKFIPEEVSEVNIIDERGVLRLAYQTDAVILSKILDEIAFVNRRLDFSQQVCYEVFFASRAERPTRWKDIIHSLPMTQLLAS